MTTPFEPSIFSAEGFLGTDARSVDAIITEDAKAMADLGTTPVAIADGLMTIYSKVQQCFGDTCKLGEGLTGTFFESMGRIPSPFSGEGTFPKGEALIHDHGTGKKWHLTRLGIHMICQHGFFQGVGNPYRIDPTDAQNLILRVSA